MGKLESCGYYPPARHKLKNRTNFIIYYINLFIYLLFASFPNLCRHRETKTSHLCMPQPNTSTFPGFTCTNRTPAIFLLNKPPDDNASDMLPARRGNGGRDIGRYIDLYYIIRIMCISFQSRIVVPHCSPRVFSTPQGFTPLPLPPQSSQDVSMISSPGCILLCLSSLLRHFNSFSAVFIRLAVSQWNVIIRTRHGA